MPGTNAGTGQPLTFCCARCRHDAGQDAMTSAIFKVHKRLDRAGIHGKGWEVTGLRRESWNGGRGGRSDSQYQYQYRCLLPACGHVGWSRHIDVASDYYKHTTETPT